MLNPLSHQGTPQIFSLCHLFDFLSCLFWLLLFLIYTFNFNILSLNFLSREILCFKILVLLSFMLSVWSISTPNFSKFFYISKCSWEYALDYVSCKFFVLFCMWCFILCLFLLLPHLQTFYSFLFSPLWYGWIVYICYASSDFKKILKWAALFRSYYFLWFMWLNYSWHIFHFERLFSLILYLKTKYCDLHTFSPCEFGIVCVSCASLRPPPSLCANPGSLSRKDISSAVLLLPFFPFSF